MTYLLSLLIWLFSPADSGEGNTINDNDCNCCSEKHRQFDFWLGTWDVYAGEK